MILGLSLLVVFLILAAQYESWSLPFSVLLGTPIAVFWAFLALALRGLEANVYAQIALVTLVGLAAKNAILIVEFAKLEYDKGKTAAETALEGARLRLRPILMTAFAFILGVVPLVIASGSGAVGRQILGTAVIGGMLAASVIAIFLIPVSFTDLPGLAERDGVDRRPGVVGGVPRRGAPGAGRRGAPEQPGPRGRRRARGGGALPGGRAARRAVPGDGLPGRWLAGSRYTARRARTRARRGE